MQQTARLQRALLVIAMCPRTRDTLTLQRRSLSKTQERKKYIVGGVSDDPAQWHKTKKKLNITLGPEKNTATQSSQNTPRPPHSIPSRAERRTTRDIPHFPSVLRLWLLQLGLMHCLHRIFSSLCRCGFGRYDTFAK